MTRRMPGRDMFSSGRAADKSNYGKNAEREQCFCACLMNSLLKILKFHTRSLCGGRRAYGGYDGKSLRKVPEAHNLSV
jgi:hypothetical protein